MHQVDNDGISKRRLPFPHSFRLPQRIFSPDAMTQRENCIHYSLMDEASGLLSVASIDCRGKVRSERNHSILMIPGTLHFGRYGFALPWLSSYFLMVFLCFTCIMAREWCMSRG